MERMSVSAAREPAAIGRDVRLQGWIRTRRDSKGGFSFLELNDGSSQANIQIVADAKLENYESEIHRLAAGCSVTVEGQVRQSPAKGQPTEVHAARIIVHGWSDPETYPLQKKNHSLEFLRTIAHLRPRTNTFGAIARVRNQVSRSIHDFFQEQGFLYVHSPIITASDCEGAGEMFKVTTLDLAKLPRQDGEDRFQPRFLPPPGLSHRQRPVERRDFRLRAGQGLHVRPDVPRGKLEHVAPSGRVLDGRAGNGLLRAGRQHAAGRGVFETHLPRRASTAACRKWNSSASASTRR